MKRYSVTLLLALLAGCTTFPTRYERIEPDALRPIGFAYEPCAEGAPGDTIRVRAYFAGKKVASVRWQMSYSYVMNDYGEDTVLDVFTLAPLATDSHLPDSTIISFVVPDSTFYKTKSISPKMLGMVRPALPAPMQALSQQELAAVLEAMAAVNFEDPADMAAFLQTWGPTLGIASLTAGAMDTLMMTAGTLLSVFSIPGILYANVTAEDGQSLKVKGSFSIRYNRRFENSPVAEMLPVNHNPAIRWIGVYKVHQTGIQSFNPAASEFAGKYTLSYLYNELYPDSVSDTVVIEKGYTYYAAADTGIVSFNQRAVDSIAGTDSAWKLIPADSVTSDTSIDRYRYVSPKTGRDSLEFETWFYDWQYQNLDLDSVTMPLDSLFMLMPAGSSRAGLLPSIDKKLSHVKLWVSVFDTYLGEFNRPVGFTIKNVDLYFKYAD
jgi:hypothetical protein